MNPAFIILLLLGAVILWFSLSSVFYSVGDLISQIWKDVVDEIKKEESEDEEG